MPGVYPFALLIKYNDANGYPFSAIANHKIEYKEEQSSEINGVSENIEIDQDSSGELVLTLRNYDVQTHEAKATLYLPRELKTDKNLEILTIESLEKEEVTFQIESFGALLGSSYTVFASIEYEDGDYHYTSFSSSKVSVVKQTTQAGGSNLIFLAILISVFIILLIIFALYRIKEKKN